MANLRTEHWHKVGFRRGVKVPMMGGGVKVSEEFTAIASDLFCSGRDWAAREV